MNRSTRSFTQNITSQTLCYSSFTQEDKMVSIELGARTPAPEWGGPESFVAHEEDAAN